MVKRRMLGLLSMFALLSLAATGPEAPGSLPSQNPMVYDFAKARGPGHIVFSRLTIPERPYGEDGFDFGGRAGYGCMFVEIVDGGATTSLSDDVVIARIVGERYENLGQDPDLYVYTDTPNRGAGADKPCSNGYGDPNPTGRASAEELSRSTSPGEPSHAEGHIIQVWQDGVEVGRIQVPHAEIEFVVEGGPGRGETSWWFRGDTDGEILLWYENPDTPVPHDYGIIARLSVVSYFGNVTFDDCVIGNPQGTPCPQAYPNEPAPPPPVTQVTLGPGTSELSCPDDSNPVVTQADPLQVSCP
jgi:hypothetical protein